MRKPKNFLGLDKNYHPIKIPKASELAKKIGRGRRKIPIDWNVVIKLLESGCHGVEVAAYFGVNPSILYRRTEKDLKMSFTELSMRCRANGDAAIKAAQMYLAINGTGGDRGMLIWLGKNRLGQRDDPVVDVKFDGKLANTLDMFKTVKKPEDFQKSQAELVAKQDMKIEAKHEIDHHRGSRDWENDPCISYCHEEEA